MVLDEEANAGGTPRLGCPREDQDIRLLAGVAMPASMTVSEHSLGSPCVGGMLSSFDIAGTLLPVVPAGISFLVGAVNPAGSDGPNVAGSPVGPSPSDSDPAGSDGPYVAGALLAQMGRILIHLATTLMVSRESVFVRIKKKQSGYHLLKPNVTLWVLNIKFLPPVTLNPLINGLVTFIFVIFIISIKCTNSMSEWLRPGLREWPP